MLIPCKKSTLLDFLAVLRGVFAKEPPMISKQQAQFGPPKQTQPTPPPVPPPPEELRRPAQVSAAASTSQQPIPPPKPPKPYENQSSNGQYPRPPTSPRAPVLPPKPLQAISKAGYGQSEAPSWRQQPSDYPSYQQSGPALRHPPRPSIEPTPAPNSYRQSSYDSPVSPLTPANGNNQPLPSRYQQPAPPPQESAFPVNHTVVPIYRNDGNSAHPMQAASANAYPPYQQHQVYTSTNAQPVPKPKPVIPDIMDSPLDVTLPSQSGALPSVPAPPIPPNPEKDALLNALRSTFYAQVNQIIASNTAAIAPLQAQQEALRASHARLQAEMNELQTLDAALASNEQILVEAMREADRVMEEAKRRKVPDVDEVLVAPAVVGGQLYNLCAEERALEDALFVLGRALDKGRVGADVFVKVGFLKSFEDGLCVLTFLSLGANTGLGTRTILEKGFDKENCSGIGAR